MLCGSLAQSPLSPEFAPPNHLPRLERKPWRLAGPGPLPAVRTDARRLGSCQPHSAGHPRPGPLARAVSPVALWPGSVSLCGLGGPFHSPSPAPLWSQPHLPIFTPSHPSPAPKTPSNFLSPPPTVSRASVLCAPTASLPLLPGPPTPPPALLLTLGTNGVPAPRRLLNSRKQRIRRNQTHPRGSPGPPRPWRPLQGLAGRTRFAAATAGPQRQRSQSRRVMTRPPTPALPCLGVRVPL